MVGVGVPAQAPGREPRSLARKLEGGRLEKPRPRPRISLPAPHSQHPNPPGQAGHHGDVQRGLFRLPLPGDARGQARLGDAAGALLLALFARLAPPAPAYDMIAPPKRKAPLAKLHLLPRAARAAGAGVCDARGGRRQPVAQPRGRPHGLPALGEPRLIPAAGQPRPQGGTTHVCGCVVMDVLWCREMESPGVQGGGREI